MAKKRVSKANKTEKIKKKKMDHIYEKKPLVEFVVAVLSIPSIILLLILNFNSIRNLNSAKTTPTPSSGSSTTAPNFFARPITRQAKPTLSASSSQAPCNKSLGPVNITSPNEGDTVNSNPVEVDISYDDMNYCTAVWSYSINDSNWSDYNNNNVALYNLPDGPIKFQLRVKSLTSSDTTTLTRNFTYNGQTVLPTIASGSAH